MPWQDAWRRWPWLACAAALAFVAWTHRDYGVTWDEDIQDRYGQLALRYFRSWGSDTSYEGLEDLRFYSPTVEIALVALRGGDESTRFDRRHFWLGVLSIAVIPAIALLVRSVRRPDFGVLVTLSLFLMPRFLGHIHNNSKDVPLVVAATVYMAALARTLQAARIGWSGAVCAGLALGLPLAVRPAFLPLALALACAAWLWARVCGLRTGIPDGTAVCTGSRALRVPGLIAASLAIGWACMVVPWPHAHAAPVRRPLEAILQMASFPRIYPVLFDGQVIRSDTLPARYLAQYLAITIPPSIWLLAALGALGAMRANRFRGSPRMNEAFLAGLGLLWFGIPVLAFAVLRPNVYDGIRHFLFVLPAVALLAGLGALRILDSLRATRMRALGWPVTLGLVCAPMPANVALHPYQATYFNEFVGGLSGAAGRYDVDYWASCFREAILDVNRRATTSVRVLLGVRTPYPKAGVTYYAEPGVDVMTLTEAAAAGDTSGRTFDYYVAPTRRNMAALFPDAPIVSAVVRDEVPFCVVRDLRGFGSDPGSSLLRQYIRTNRPHEEDRPTPVGPSLWTHMGKRGDSIARAILRAP